MSTDNITPEVKQEPDTKPEPEAQPTQAEAPQHHEEKHEEKHEDTPEQPKVEASAGLDLGVGVSVSVGGEKHEVDVHASKEERRPQRVAAAAPSPSSAKKKSSTLSSSKKVTTTTSTTTTTGLGGKKSTTSTSSTITTSEGSPTSPKKTSSTTAAAAPSPRRVAPPPARSPGKNDHTPVRPIDGISVTLVKPTRLCEIRTEENRKLREKLATTKAQKDALKKWEIVGPIDHNRMFPPVFIPKDPPPPKLTKQSMAATLDASKKALGHWKPTTTSRSFDLMRTHPGSATLEKSYYSLSPTSTRVRKLSGTLHSDEYTKIPDMPFQHSKLSTETPAVAISISASPAAAPSEPAAAAAAPAAAAVTAASPTKGGKNMPAGEVVHVDSFPWLSPRNP